VLKDGKRHDKVDKPPKLSTAGITLCVMRTLERIVRRIRLHTTKSGCILSALNYMLIYKRNENRNTAVLIKIPHSNRRKVKIDFIEIPS